MLIVGLAPAAHGGNRTGRMFTGDRAGYVLIACMFEAGLANQPTSTHPGDGLRLIGSRLTAPVHCAPPGNKPAPEERDNCRHWLITELGLLAPTLRSIVVLGGWGWQALLPALAESGWAVPKPKPRFTHAAHYELAPARSDRAPLHLFGTYHPSQQNTFTGRLTPAMLTRVLRDAATTAGLTPPAS